MKCSDKLMWRGFDTVAKTGKFENILQDAKELQTFTKFTKKCFISVYAWLTVPDGVVNNVYAVVAPFDTYKPSEVSPGSPLVTAPEQYSYITSCLKKPSLTKAELKSYFPADKMKFAALQGVPAMTKLGKYATTHFSRTCTSGDCQDWGLDSNWTKATYTGFYPSGGVGDILLYSNELGQITVKLDFDQGGYGRGTFLQCKNDVFWSSAFTCEPKLNTMWFQAGGRDNPHGTSGTTQALADKKVEEHKFHIARDCFVASFRYSKLAANALTEGEIYIAPDPDATDPYAVASGGTDQPTQAPKPHGPTPHPPEPRPHPKPDPQPKPDHGHHQQQHHAEQNPQAKEGGQQPQKQQPQQQPKQPQQQPKQPQQQPRPQQPKQQEAKQEDARLTPAGGQQAAVQQRPASAR